MSQPTDGVLKGLFCVIAHLRDLKKSADHAFCAITYSIKDKVARNWSCKVRSNAKVAEGFRPKLNLDAAVVASPASCGGLLASSAVTPFCMYVQGMM